MRILITGNAGFIGQETWTALERNGFEVYGLDDLSRKTSIPIDHPNAIVGDVNYIQSIRKLDQDFDWVIHLAAQVSVVAGEEDPSRDFHSNAQGTFEVIQWAKERNAQVIYASSNKVFGDLPAHNTPVLDSQPLAPRTNYGVSKTVGALYCLDYEPSWVLHQSCIYGPSQIGEVDQGWIGWLAQSIRSGRSITCFGDGSQVRDLLHVKDLVRLYTQILSGNVEPGQYVVGGGPTNAVSFSAAVSSLGGEISAFAEWRPHDQKYFVSANEGLLRQGWQPEISAQDSLNTLAANGSVGEQGQILHAD